MTKNFLKIAQNSYIKLNTKALFLKILNSVKNVMGAFVETYLTIEELANYLKVAEQTIRRWVLNREIPFCKIKKVIRFRVTEIEKWIDNNGELSAAIVGNGELSAKENDSLFAGDKIIDVVDEAEIKAGVIND